MAPASDPRRTLLLIAAPMWATFAVMRLYLHLINHNTDLILFGYEIHHLFSGVVLLIGASFMASFNVPAGRWRDVTPVLQGIGGALVLDQIVFLIVTDGTNDSYILPVSFWGGLVFMIIGTGFLGLVSVFAGKRRGSV